MSNIFSTLNNRILTIWGGIQNEYENIIANFANSNVSAGFRGC